MGAIAFGARTTTIFMGCSFLDGEMLKRCLRQLEMRAEYMGQNLLYRHTMPKAMENIAEIPTTAQVGRNRVVSTPIPNAGRAT